MLVKLIETFQQWFNSEGWAYLNIKIGPIPIKTSEMTTLAKYVCLSSKRPLREQVLKATCTYFPQVKTLLKSQQNVI